MRTLIFPNKELATVSDLSAVGYGARLLDRLRIFLLQLTMRNQILRQIYCDRATRLGVNFILLSCVYLLVSLKWSILLLIVGPILFGYPHLVASYRFLQRPKLILKSGWISAKIFQFFLVLTAISLVIRFVGYPYTNIAKLPYGVWEILLSVVALGIFKLELKSMRHSLLWIMTLVAIGLILKLAWINPLNFVGFALIFHNWVGYGHWFFAAKDFRNRLVAIISTVLFAAVHIFVFAGFLDSWISIVDFEFFLPLSLGQSSLLPSAQSFEINGWALASWSDDPLIWNRAIVLYAFGLSLHYFVWLRAIPQCLDQKSVPNSFRRSLESLRGDCGVATTAGLFLMAVIILGMWILVPQAGRIYFGIAMLHGWLELTFLIVTGFSRALKI